MHNEVAATLITACRDEPSRETIGLSIKLRISVYIAHTRCSDKSGILQLLSINMFQFSIN